MRWLVKLAALPPSLLFAPTTESLLREVEGEDLRVALFRPEQATEKSPAILFIHGGGWTSGHRAMLYPYADYFAKRGWVTLSASYRTYGSHGTKVSTALDDARHALRWVAEHADELGLDPSRIVVSGGSAGGHLAAAIAMIDPEIAVAGMVLFNPAIDTALEPVPEGWDAIAPLFEGKGAEVSPAHHVRGGLPPTIVFHGSVDGLVPVEQSRDFCQAMRASGNVCELSVFEGAGHGFFNHGFGHFDEVAAQAEAFLRAQKLAPIPQEVSFAP